MKLPIKYKNNNLDLFNLLWLIWGLETILSITVVISRNFSIQWTYAQTEVVGQIMGKSFNFFIYKVEILLYSYLTVRLWNYHYEIKPSPFLLRRWILWYILLSAGPQEYLKQVDSRIGTCSTQSNIFRIEKSEGPMKGNLRNKRRTGISLVVQSACHCRGHGFDPWSGKIPQATGQLNPCSPTTEPMHPRTQAPRQEKTPQGEAWTPQPESGPASCSQRSPRTAGRPSAARSRKPSNTQAARCTMFS